MKADHIMEKKTNILNILFNVLFWGSLWGIVEATLGTLLHLAFFAHLGIFARSSTVIIPIALFLMAICYKRTKSFSAVLFMGCLAATIKLTTAFIIGFRDIVYFPAIYIIVEALAIGGALALFRPTNVVSTKTLCSIVVANTAYQFVYLLISRGANWTAGVEKYLLMYNCVAILYSFLVCGVSYGIIKLINLYKKEESKLSITRIINSPITASLVVTIAVTLTLTLAAI